MKIEEVMPTHVIAEAHLLNDSSLKEGSVTFYNYDVSKWIDDVSRVYDGKVKMIYIDPPFMTGKSLYYSQKVGVEGWKGNKDSILKHLAYKDIRPLGRNSFLTLMKNVINTAHRLLTEDGSIFVHVDYRLSPYMRAILDEIFGESNFLNEIIWQYNSGGRATNHFSRKHDVILFYRKTKNNYFNIKETAIKRGRSKRNNMKKSFDESGRLFYSIKSAGREYRYYEDDYVNPGDVWTDISHLQQKDPERTGYDTQKPEKLLERIVKVSTQPGDLVLDFFAGSGTLAAVAIKLGRNWLGVDSSVFSLHVTRKRIVKAKNIDTFYKIKLHHNADGMSNSSEIGPIFTFGTIENGWMDIKLEQYTNRVNNSEKEKADSKLVSVDYWSVGYIEDGIFFTESIDMRTQKNPELSGSLKIELGFGKELGIHLIDVSGVQHFYKLNPKLS